MIKLKHNWCFNTDIHGWMRGLLSSLLTKQQLTCTNCVSYSENSDCYSHNCLSPLRPKQLCTTDVIIPILQKKKQRLKDGKSSAQDQRTGTWQPTSNLSELTLKAAHFPPLHPASDKHVGLVIQWSKCFLSFLSMVGTKLATGWNDKCKLQ